MEIEKLSGGFSLHGDPTIHYYHGNNGSLASFIFEAKSKEKSVTLIGKFSSTLLDQEKIHPERLEEGWILDSHDYKILRRSNKGKIEEASDGTVSVVLDQGRILGVFSATFGDENWTGSFDGKASLVCWLKGSVNPDLQGMPESSDFDSWTIDKHFSSKICQNVLKNLGI